MKVDYNNYKLMDFTCEDCGWSGKGQALVNGDFSEESFIGDLDCPKCFKLVAHWQSPLNDDNQS